MAYLSVEPRRQERHRSMYRDVIVGLTLLAMAVVAGGAVWMNGYLVHQQDALRAELYMTTGERDMQGRELDKCRIQRRDLRESR